MKKVKKLKDNKYLSTETIVHKNKQLSKILDEVVIIETIENENGKAIKFSDGTMICSLNTYKDVAVNNEYGNLYQGTYDWNYPVAFASNPVVAVGMFQWGEVSASWGTCYSNNNTKAFLRIYDVVSRNAGITYIKATAIGSWK